MTSFDKIVQLIASMSLDWLNKRGPVDRETFVSNLGLMLEDLAKNKSLYHPPGQIEMHADGVKGPVGSYRPPKLDEGS